MYSLKGFVEFAGFANNIPGVIAKIGELSPVSYTYSKEKGYYDDPDYKDIEITSFLSVEDDGTTKTAVEIPSEIRSNIFKICNWIYGQMIATGNTQDRINFLAIISNEFSQLIEGVQCGAISTDGTNHIPDWVCWKFIGSEHYIRLWFTDESFRNQYDEYEIVVVPPLEPLDTFFMKATDVKVRLEAMTATIMVDKLQKAKDDYPETIIKVETYDYYAPGNPDFRVPSRWGILIYGMAGNNPDCIKEAICDYIMERTEHTRDEWAEILPDLFRRTEFMIIPLWDQYGIPNRVLEKGIYSPLIKHERAVEVGIAALLPPASGLADPKHAPYTEGHIRHYLSFMGHPYRSIALVIVGGPENRQGKFYLTDFFPDFISVNTASIDFNRMSVKTQEFATILADLIYNAEQVDTYTVLPFGMTRMYRNNQLCVVKSIDNINIIVLAKSNFPGANP